MHYGIEIAKAYSARRCNTVKMEYFAFMRFYLIEVDRYHRADRETLQAEMEASARVSRFDDAFCKFLPQLGGLVSDAYGRLACRTWSIVE